MARKVGQSLRLIMGPSLRDAGQGVWDEHRYRPASAEAFEAHGRRAHGIELRVGELMVGGRSH